MTLPRAYRGFSEYAMTKIHPIQREAERLAAGRRHRSFRCEVRGAALDRLNALEALASRKGLDAAGLMTLLILQGHRTVTTQLGTMPDLESPKA